MSWSEYRWAEARYTILHLRDGPELVLHVLHADSSLTHPETPSHWHVLLSLELAFGAQALAHEMLRVKPPHMPTIS